MRRFVAAAFLAAAPISAFADCVSVVSANLIEPTDAYGHGAVPKGEFAGLSLGYQGAGSPSILSSEIRLSTETAVFEDTQARVVDLDADGCAEVVVTTSNQQSGAFVSVYGMAFVPRPSADIPANKQTQTVPMVLPLGSNAPIGARHRWLAVVGIADFDGDGVQDIAYIDRPHLAKTLRVLRTVPSGIVKGRQMFTFDPLASVTGLTNHHYKAPQIEGGLRTCAGEAPVIVTADAAWAHIIETRYDAGNMRSQRVAAYVNAKSFAPFLQCDEAK
ncbi:hypothetical protein EDD53_0151 [Pacificibacter maritimus]|uniref:VCBS repeat protein n=1 Tax=Pacificibacter maritimus TaxID=762213 RepID=A0A3N4UM09_9RHOB|nr:VCBS repeat-containing protein [Pacificibacter maritimus]RPE71038.1 hypothetical protein EDD53_0151 [Pacificibacter maritimus]